MSDIVGAHNGLHSQLLRQTIAYVPVMTLLTFSALMYLLARQGALYRSRGHVRVPRAEIDAFMTGSRPSLTVLVPSYCEDPAVVRSTLLSAALQEYPGMRIVLQKSTAGKQAYEGQNGAHRNLKGRSRYHSMKTKFAICRSGSLFFSR